MSIQYNKHLAKKKLVPNVNSLKGNQIKKVVPQLPLPSVSRAVTAFKREKKTVLKEDRSSNY